MNHVIRMPGSPGVIYTSTRQALTTGNLTWMEPEPNNPCPTSETKNGTSFSEVSAVPFSEVYLG